MKKNWCITELINWGESFLFEKGIEQPRLNFELMLAKVLKLNRLELYLNYGQVLSENELEKIKEYLLRRVKGEPVQYILGDVNFLGFSIKVSPDVLIPRPETEMMAAKAFAFCKNKNIKKIVDLCSGSGCLAVSAALAFPGSVVDAVDISPEALKIGAENARLNNAGNSINFIEEDISLFIKEKRDYDLVLFNPPYISADDYDKLDQSVVCFEPRIALTDEEDGFSFYYKLAAEAKSFLSTEGVIFMEFGINMEKKIREIFNSKGFKAKFFKDLNEIVRFALIEIDF